MDERAEQAKKNLQKIFKENPELKEAFVETIQEMKKPENIKKMAKDISDVIGNVQIICNCLKDKK